MLRILVLLFIGMGVAPAPVWADTPFPDSRRDTDPERQRYDPVGRYLGNLLLHATAELRFAYEDGGETPGQGVSLHPSVQMREESDRYTATVSASAAGRWHWGATRYQVQEYRLAGEVAFSVWGDSPLRLVLLRQRDFERPGSPTLPSSAAQPVPRDVRGVEVHSASRLGPLHLGESLVLRGLTFGAVRQHQGGWLDQSDRDRVEALNTTRLGTDLGASVHLWLESRQDLRAYHQATDRYGLARLSLGHSEWIGGSGQIGPRLRVDGAVGRMTHRYSSTLVEAVESLVWDVSLAVAATPLLTLRGQGWRGVEETAAVGHVGVVATGWAVAAHHELLRNLVLTARAEVVDRRFLGPALPERRDRALTLDMGATWMLGPHVYSGLDLHREHRRSTDATAAFTRHRLTLRLGVRL